MKATQVLIKKECRELHGKDKALELALDYVRQQYELYISLHCNKDATIKLEIHIDR